MGAMICAFCNTPSDALFDSKPRLIVATTVEVPSDGVDKYMGLMEEIVEQTRLDASVVRYDFLRDQKTPSKFCHYLCFSSEQAWQRYQASPLFKKREALAPGRSSENAYFTTAGLPDWAWQFEDQKTGGPASTGFAVLVTVDVKEDRMDDFMVTIKADALGIRDRDVDPGGLRMDLLKSTEGSNKFGFYECYDDEKAMGQHRQTAHFAGWQEFKKSGGIINQSVVLLETTSIPGNWAFQG